LKNNNLVSSIKEIRSRTETVNKVFIEKRKLFTGKINLELKERIMKCLVWSVAVFAAESNCLNLSSYDRMAL